MIRNGAVMVDVRELREAEAKSFDVEGIMVVPLSDFGKRFREIPKNEEVILACRSGNRSLMAAGFLAENGYGKVFNLQDGMMSWDKEGLPIRRSAQEGFFARFIPGMLREA
ncbi:MAG: rhodanese-like domain-containing protein [Chlorobiaceae bacterium]|nr:rhodanese-like domain-containing protein [Chlorobiaceae bacterium]